MDDKVDNWLKQSEEDLKWAQVSLEEGLLRGACFASQQASEKSLKAFLLSKDISIPKIHDLFVLNQKCIEVEPSFKGLEESCNILSPYYLSSRYPDIAQFEEYSRDQVVNVVEQAKKVVEFVKTQLKTRP